MNLAPFLIAISVLPLLKRIINNGYNFKLIDAHYFYPDGVAAALLGKWLNKPVVITARGTDLNLIPRYFIPRKMIVWAARQAQELITVCQALKDVLVKLGISAEKVTVIRNGVDLRVFHPPLDRKNLRNKLNITGKCILSVGYLIERKGHHLIIAALKQLPDITLYIAGDGGNMDQLKRLSRKFGVHNRVIFLGRVNHEELADYYGAVDILVLASSREGWANVLLESMACGTPVVATEIWGTPEIVAVPEAGALCFRSIDAIAQAISKLYRIYPDRKATRRYAEKFSWDEVTTKQIAVFNNILNGKRR
jgi:glycosyltransferase involved in cell wall biosynthesis